MEMSEVGGLSQRPELPRDNPGRLFSYAEEKQKWLRARVEGSARETAVEHLVAELNNYMNTELPGGIEVTATSSDITATTSITRPMPGSYRIETGKPPFNEDDELLGLYKVTGALHSFHVGTQGDVRAYIQSTFLPEETPGGVFIPLVSVGVEGSAMQFTSYLEQEQINKDMAYVMEQIKDYDEVRDLTLTLWNVLEDKSTTVADRLRNSSLCMAEIARVKGDSAQVIDAMLDVITLKLGLHLPQDIKALKHHIILTKWPTPSYKIQGQEDFRDVVPQLALVGETVAKKIGLLFHYNEQSVEIPVQYLLTINRTTDG